MPSNGTDADAGQPSQGVRSVITLLLFFHLFSAFGLLVAGQIPVNRDDGRLLAQRFSQAFSPYGQLLNIESRARFYLTHGTSDDVDHRLEYLPEGASPSDQNAWVLVTNGPQGTLPHLRLQYLTDTIAYYAEPERNAEDSAAYVASSVGSYLRNQLGVKAQELRVRKHNLQELKAFDEGEVFLRDPNYAGYFREVYRAKILDFGNGEVRVQKVEDKGQVAPATRGQNQ
jgi:hypothetical protein